ncbi:hypothetical protein SteCoe_34889 [Stentor coeruleus]|uniref:Brix domain-containing protein n=1 Tax=Stentor coeruleus TaxID=5963 RepID=A0A1R2ATW2_9CILI|nr:hypothetical protein SteCoe_34889 [Stentor coeruleus]
MEDKPKQSRTLILCSRGVSHQQRHLVSDLIRLLPHSKKAAKIDRKKNFSAFKDLAEMHSCNTILYLEGRKKICFLWLARYPNGPSIKFLVQNIRTCDELKLTGNCLKASRPILSFDKSFQSEPYLQVIQQMLMQTFATPEKHSRAMPFVDHALSFSQIFNRIYFRNFEITQGNEDIALVEIGPRFVLTPIKILSGLISGETLYKNGNYVRPREKALDSSVWNGSDKKMKKKRKIEFVGNPEEPSLGDAYGYS